MKSIRIMLLTVLALNVPAFSQAPGTPGPNGQGYGPLAVLERVRQIASEMNLPSDEKTKVDAVLNDSRQDALQLRGQMQDMTPQERNDKVRDFVSDVRQKIEAQLTDTQKQEFERKMDDRRPQASVGPGGIAERFRANLESLNLTDDQKQKTDAILKDTAEKLRDLPSGPDASARQTKFRDTMQDMRQRIAEVLTPDQMQALREKMQQNPGGPAPSASSGQAPTTGSGQASRPPTVAADTSPPATRPAPMVQQAVAQEKPKPPVATPPLAKAGVSALTPIDSGKVAPDFKLIRLDGQPFQLSSLKGHAVVLIFGSYTCPTFRDRAAGLDKLYRDYQGKANIMLIYTSEAHPTDGWDIDRNKRDNILIQQPTTDQARKSIARQMRDSMHLGMPFLLDTMDDTVATQYGGFPNGAIVINRDGVITSTEQWAEPLALRHLIEETLADGLATQTP